MAEVRISAEPRTEFGKGAARRIRREKKVPAVLYGHGAAPRHVSLPGHALMLALKTSNVLLELDLDGGRELALPKEVQRDPIKGFLEHVDLLVVTRGEKVVVGVPIHIEGDIVPDGLLNHDLTELQVEAEATHIPAQIVVDVTGLALGHHLLAGEVALPEGTILAGDPEAMVLSIVAAPTAAQLEEELAGAEAEAGIVHEEKLVDAGESVGESVTNEA